MRAPQRSYREIWPNTHPSRSSDTFLMLFKPTPLHTHPCSMRQGYIDKHNLSLSLSLSLSFILSLKHTHAHTPTHTHAHKYKHIYTHTLFLLLSFYLFFPFSLNLTYLSTHTPSLLFSNKPTLSLAPTHLEYLSHTTGNFCFCFCMLNK